MAYFDLTDARLYYEEAGTGPAVVLLHGMGFDLRCWAPHVEALAERYRVVRYDQRGYGRSPLGEGDAPICHALDLRALVEGLGLDRPVLVGWSMGGQNATEYALRYPDGLRGLAVLSAALQGMPFTDAARRTFAALRTTAPDVAAMGEVWLASPFVAPSLATPCAATIRQIVGDYGWSHWLVDRPNLRLDPPMVDRLDEVWVPTLVLVGEHDSEDMRWCARKLASEVPGARFEVLEGLGHLALLEDPAAVQAVLLPWLAGLSA